MKRPLWMRGMALLLAILLTGCGNHGTTSTGETTTPPSPSAQTETQGTTNPPTTSEPELAHQHKYSPAETVQASCTAEGYTVYACECGDSYIGDRVEKLEHRYEEIETVAPTEENEGYTIYVCQGCLETRHDNFVPALEEEIDAIQRNSINMLNYLATISARIDASKGNRLMLEEVYTILLNGTNPGKIDEETQEHMEDLRNTIHDFINISVKRERLQYLHNQDKAAAIRSAVPDSVSVMSIATSRDWKRLVAAVVYTAIDSYNSYASTVDSLDREYLISTWELDDEETEEIRSNRESYFEYMVDIVQKYQFDGNITLNENAVTRFAEICENSDLPTKVQFLESEKKTYEHFANYWLELADCYYELERYEDCLLSIERYQNLSVGIFRKDYDYARILPKAIVAARETNKGDDVLEGFAEDILNNTDNEDWSMRYLAAQVYADLYSRNPQKQYLEKAYQIALDNINELKAYQQELNARYLADVQPVTVEEPNYSRMQEEDAKVAKKAYKAEKKRADAYNKTLRTARKTELPPLYEPLVVNCDFLFALAHKLNISDAQKSWIEDILQTKDKGVFLSDAVNDRYSFSDRDHGYSIALNETTVEIPANLLTQGATIEVTVKGTSDMTCEDWNVTKVKRNGEAVESFVATFASESFGEIEWAVGMEVTVKIYNGTDYEPMTFGFKVTGMEYKFPFGEKPVFEVV